LYFRNAESVFGAGIERIYLRFQSRCVVCGFLKAFNADDYIRWLNKLLQETSREPDCSTVDNSNADDIYDDIYNWAVYQSNGQFHEWFSFLRVS